MVTPVIEIPADLQPYWTELGCGFPRVAEMFPDCMRNALAKLSAEGVTAYIEHARYLGRWDAAPNPF